VLDVRLALRTEGDHELPVLVVELEPGRRAISSAVLGGGVGPAGWVVNAHVLDNYDRIDPVDHLADIARALGLRGPGLGMLTAADVGSTEWPSSPRWVSPTRHGPRRDTTPGHLDRARSTSSSTFRRRSATPRS
jgi:hypothetical protein